MTASGDSRTASHVHIAVVGAGFAGLGVAHNLIQRGIEDFTILERAHSVGGVWRDNTYPGAACDVPSHLYSLSFAPKPDWERTFSRGPQIREYLEAVARDEGLEPRIRFGEDVSDATWNEDAGRWELTTTNLSLTADVLISCAGPLTEPTYPDVPGLDSFAGLTFHSNRWDHEHDLTDRRVAVIGTGASSVQLVPEIQKLAKRLVVFQRTPGWVLPRIDRRVTALERRLLQRVPALTKLIRAGQYLVRDALHFPMIQRHPHTRAMAQGQSQMMLRRQIADPQLRTALTPNYEIGCKRVLLSNEWYRALAQPNVDVVPHALTGVGEHTVTAADGSAHEVDAIVFATGFETTGSPVFARIRGGDGRSIGEVWGTRPRFHRATTMAGFPNMFLMCGPGTGLGHGSMIWQMEAQMTYLMDALALMRDRQLSRLEVRPEAQDGYMGWVHSELDETVWSKGGCDSWYLDDSGRPTALWPETMWGFRQMLRRFDVENYAAA